MFKKVVNKMYNIIIVDDEDYIRNLFYNFLDWKSIGFTITGDFSCAKDALDFISKNKVDVVVTDITMPGYSGIDFVKTLRSQNNDVPVVFISGHSEFSFAHEAINLGVLGYILKPITYSELYNTFNKISELLQKKTKTFVSESEMIKRSYLFSSCFFGNYSDTKKIKSDLEELNIYIDPISTPVALTLVIPKNIDMYLEKTWKHNKQRIDLAMNNILYENEENAYIIPITFFANMMIVIIAPKKNLKNLSDYVKSKSKKIEETFMNFMQLSVELVFIGHFENLSKVNTDLIISAVKRSSKSQNDFNNTFISQVSELIINNLGHNITQDEIAKKFNMNIASFRKLFKKITGEKFIDFSIKTKLNVAKRLLVETDYKISDISARVGYNSEDHFYATFKKYVGTTPAEYRRTNIHTKG